MAPSYQPDWRGIGGRVRRRWAVPSIAAGAIALATGVVVFAIATTVFPYHSNNHDEAVYLHQAAMLLAGQLELTPGELADAFRPWFFVQDGGRLYPKYAPVSAAMYAGSIALFGEPRVTLAVVAAANVFLTYILGRMVFDRRVGLVASGMFAVAPLALVTSSVFLPYAPSTFLHLVFAVAYLRGSRDRSPPAAAIAGIAIGLAFFARPFTAVLFALPFILHAGIRTGGSVLGNDLHPWTETVRRNALTALLGSAFVCLALWYNLQLTGAAFVFPYEAFAPLDGPGFGLRQLEGHAVEYTPSLALEANGYVLWYFATRWFTAGPVGTTLAILGAGIVAVRWSDGRTDAENADAGARPDGFQLRASLVLVGVVVSVIAGNVAFWGNRNILATMTDPTDGMIAQFGPFYHFDLLVPLSLFAALAVVTGWRRAPAIVSPAGASRSVRTSRTLLVVGVLGLVLGSGMINAVAIGTPLERSLGVTEQYDRVYEPIDEEAFEDALVFVPAPYGHWQHHPFQSLRNQPGFDGPVVYALDRGAGEDFRVIDAYPDRSLYRFTYRGEWSPDPNRPVNAKLEPLTVHEGRTIAAETAVGVPDDVSRATLRIENRAGDHASASVDDPDSSIVVPWSVRTAGASIAGAGTEDVVPVDDIDRLVVTVTLVQPDGSTLTYRQEATVRADDDRVAVVWPPDRFVCPLVTDCGTAGTYLPDDPDAHLAGVSFETTVDTVDP